MCFPHLEAIVCEQLVDQCARPTDVRAEQVDFGRHTPRHVVWPKEIRRVWQEPFGVGQSPISSAASSGPLNNTYLRCGNSTRASPPLAQPHPSQTPNQHCSTDPACRARTSSSAASDSGSRSPWSGAEPAKTRNPRRIRRPDSDEAVKLHQCVRDLAGCRGDGVPAHMVSSAESAGCRMRA